MTYQALLVVAGAFLSLLFSYFPGFADWFNPMSDTKKRLTMLVLLLVVAGGAFGLACADVIVKGLICDKTGAEEVVVAFVLALMANQGTHAISPRVGRKSKTRKPSARENEAMG